MDIVAYGLMIAGVVFFFGTSVGLIRFPDFYTRMHAAGKGDSFSTVLLIAGIGVYYYHHAHGAGAELIVAKLLFIILFVFVGSPTATHAITLAGYKAHIKPWTKGKKKT